MIYAGEKMKMKKLNPNIAAYIAPKIELLHPNPKWLEPSNTTKFYLMI